MKIEYIYKKEHQDILDKIQARIDKLTERSIKDEESYYKAVDKACLESLRVGEVFTLIGYTQPQELEDLKEQLEYLKGCLTPITIKIIEEEEVLV